MEERSGLQLPIGTPYHATRRHTVGPGDTAHQPANAAYTCGYPMGYAQLHLLPNLQLNADPQLLPHTNLALNLPLVQNQPPQNFQIKDQHLLKPPSAMGASKSAEVLLLCLENSWKRRADEYVVCEFQQAVLGEEPRTVERIYTFSISNSTVAVVEKRVAGVNLVAENICSL